MKISLSATLLTFHTNVGVAQKFSVVLDGNCKCYIEYKADRPINPCGHRNSSPDPKITARYHTYTIHTYGPTSQLLDRIGQVGRFGENILLYSLNIIYLFLGFVFDMISKRHFEPRLPVCYSLIPLLCHTSTLLTNIPSRNQLWTLKLPGHHIRAVPETVTPMYFGPLIFLQIHLV